MSENDVKKASFEQICTILSRNSFLETLYLNSLKLTKEDFGNLVDSLSYNTYFKRLDLNRNQITNSAKEIVELIEKNTNLTWISLKDNWVGGSWQQFSLALDSNTRLLTLELELGGGNEFFHSQVKEKLKENLERLERINKVKVWMMILQRRKDNRVSLIPRRLLIYLLTFLII